VCLISVTFSVPYTHSLLRDAGCIGKAQRDDQGPIVIPGSRGCEFVVDPISDPISLHSVAMGGTQDAATERMANWRIATVSLTCNKIAGVESSAANASYSGEAADCYKDVDKRGQCLVLAGLVHVIAVLRPVVPSRL